MGDITNVKIGACSVKFNDVDLGHTKGGVDVSYEPKYADITVDLYGNTPADQALVSEGLIAKIKLAESTVDNLLIAIGASDAQSDGGLEAVGIGREADYKLSAVAKELVLHPLGNEPSDTSGDVVFYLAIVADKVALNYEVDKEQVFEVTFSALIDESKEDGNLLGHIGDYIS